MNKKVEDMSTKEKYDLVVEAEKALIEEMTPKVYYMLGPTQKAQLISDKIPTKPLFCLAKIKDILNNAGR